MEIPNHISAIAKIVRDDWKKIYFGAEPYLQAMEQIDCIDQMYYEDTAEQIVRYFLTNASSWRGEIAKAVKARLKELLGE
ncbi:MAG: hypothetical protein P0Y49_09255 [Candidatus Pedobacter colombiensis]|uniref:Uncharacterized protein n=1 Tax=Candidatus Pedobacter colombiensis TaxID=3121371 RepID=A0AAJ5WEX3_9SPHI|nr:hypothetical protein [Pedobacter sp.]WEK21327.1 MAG: hypothetical protein P0Y49_09255 [Pedobacter sp.]